MATNRVIFKLKKEWADVDQFKLANKLGDGQGRRIDFHDRPGLPIEFDAPLLFLYNHKHIGYLNGDLIQIDVPQVLVDDSPAFCFWLSSVQS